MNRRRDRFRSPVSTVSAAIVVSGLVLSGCAAAEPGPGPELAHDAPVSISVDADSVGQLLLGEIYQRTLSGPERDVALNAETSPEDNPKVHRLESGQANFIVGCTGELLSEMNPAAAREIAEGTDDEAENVDLVYDQFVGSLSGDLATTDPSSAQGCADAEGPEMTQNIVPVFEADLFGRAELGQLSSITKLLTTADLENMIDAVDETGSVPDAVDSWMNSNTMSTSEGSEEDSDRTGNAPEGSEDSDSSEDLDEDNSRYLYQP